MVKRFRQIYTPQYSERARELGFSDYQILILASIIEKEAAISRERFLVSSVYHNRLKRNMRLYSCPTVIYGIKNFDGNLTKKDLERYTPYNTYLIRGLPPGPICNPGKEAIVAALYPTTQYRRSEIPEGGAFSRQLGRFFPSGVTPARTPLTTFVQSFYRKGDCDFPLKSISRRLIP
jgi:hypothetical protein